MFILKSVNKQNSIKTTVETELGKKTITLEELKNPHNYAILFIDALLACIFIFVLASLKIPHSYVVLNSFTSWMIGMAGYEFTLLLLTSYYARLHKHGFQTLFAQIEKDKIDNISETKSETAPKQIEDASKLESLEQEIQELKSVMNELVSLSKDKVKDQSNKGE